MTNRQLISLLVWAAFIIGVLSINACSASWHLNKAIKKDPSIVDTSYVMNDFTINIERDTARLFEFPRKSVLKIDSATNGKLTNEEKKVITRIIEKEVLVPCISDPVLKDTLSFFDKYGGFVKIWQEGEKIKSIQKQPVLNFTKEKPNTLQRIWSRMKWYEKLGTAFCIALLIFLFLLRVFKL